MRPTSLAQVLANCHSLENINRDADIGIIKHNIPPILDGILTTIYMFLEKHPRGFINNLDFFVNRYKTKIEQAPYDMDINERRELIRDIKEGISSEISIIIRHAEGDSAVNYNPAGRTIG